MEYCPKCKSEELQFDGFKKYYCPECSWEYYQNTAAAVAGILEFEGKVLVVERNREPGKGLYDFPGGFVDLMETAEQAQRREVMEELGVELKELNYLCSAPNLYKYKGIEYCTCDIFFTGKIETNIFNIDTSEIASYYWIEKSKLDPQKFAFSSMREAIKIYLEG
jgi:NAD+ diphosphatase